MQGLKQTRSYCLKDMSSFCKSARKRQECNRKMSKGCKQADHGRRNPDAQQEYEEMLKINCNERNTSDSNSIPLHPVGPVTSGEDRTLSVGRPVEGTGICAP